MVSWLEKVYLKFIKYQTIFELHKNIKIYIKLIILNKVSQMILNIRKHNIEIRKNLNML